MRGILFSQNFETKPDRSRVGMLRVALRAQGIDPDLPLLQGQNDVITLRDLTIELSHVSDPFIELRDMGARMSEFVEAAKRAMYKVCAPGVSRKTLISQLVYEALVEMNIIADKDPVVERLKQVASDA
jgi:hypothetical protein